MGLGDDSTFVAVFEGREKLVLQGFVGACYQRSDFEVRFDSESAEDYADGWKDSLGFGILGGGKRSIQFWSR